MSYLKAKSEFNKSAAELLYDNNLYAPSVHCAYYSCLQLIKFLVKDFMNIDYPDQKIESDQLKQNSHEYVIRKLLNEVHGLSRFDYIDLRRNIYDLKSFREISDYENQIVDIDLSKKSINKANDIRSYLIRKML
jgi:uncharacterized protein (UPF0332 family)